MEEWKGVTLSLVGYEGVGWRGDGLNEGALASCELVQSVGSVSGNQGDWVTSEWREGERERGREEEGEGGGGEEREREGGREREMKSNAKARQRDNVHFCCTAVKGNDCLSSQQ